MTATTYEHEIRRWRRSDSPLRTRAEQIEDEQRFAHLDDEPTTPPDRRAGRTRRAPRQPQDVVRTQPLTGASLRHPGEGAYSARRSSGSKRTEDDMEWNRLTIATVVLGVATLFFLVSGATGTWLPVVICGVLFFIALGMVFRERAAKSRV